MNKLKTTEQCRIMLTKFIEKIFCMHFLTEYFILQAKHKGMSNEKVETYVFNSVICSGMRKIGCEKLN